VKFGDIGKPDALVIGAITEPTFKAAPMGQVKNGRLALLTAIFNHETLLKRLGRINPPLSLPVLIDKEKLVLEHLVLLLGSEPNGGWDLSCFVALILTDAGGKMFIRIGIIRVSRSMGALLLKEKRSKKIITVV
jgi:hypothetical protein